MNNSLPQRNPIISVKEARKLLGNMSESITDDELAQLVSATDTAIRIALRQYLRSKN